MSGKGFVLIHRNIEDFWVWDTEEPFDRRSAFVDLIMMMNHTDREILFDRELFTVKRGEKVTSLRDLSNRWKWSTKKVSTFLGLLEKSGTIELNKNSRCTIIKLRNYDSYQLPDASEHTKKKHSGNSAEPIRQQQGSGGEPTEKTNNKLNILNKSDKLNEPDELNEVSVRTHAHGKLNNVFLSSSDYERFKSDYPFTYERIIDELSVKIATGDPRYQKGHIGHLYVFAKNYKGKNQEDDICSSYDIQLAMQRSLQVDPNKTKYDIRC